MSRERERERERERLPRRDLSNSTHEPWHLPFLRPAIIVPLRAANDPTLVAKCTPPNFFLAFQASLVRSSAGSTRHIRDVTPSSCCSTTRGGGGGFYPRSPMHARRRTCSCRRNSPRMERHAIGAIATRQQYLIRARLDGNAAACLRQIVTQITTKTRRFAYLLFERPRHLGNWSIFRSVIVKIDRGTVRYIFNDVWIQHRRRDCAPFLK